MKLSFAKPDLIEPINIVSKAVSTRTTMPILTCILIEAEDGKIKLTGNDMEMAIETEAEGVIYEAGVVAVDARLFAEIVRKLPDGDVLLEQDNEKLNISCAGSHFSIPVRGGDEYVKLPASESKDYIVTSEFILKAMINQTLFSISANDNNKLMTGELFEIKNDQLKIVSLDGHRISIRTEKLAENYGSKQVIVPGKTLGELSKILPGETDKDVYVFFGKNNITFKFGKTVMLSRLIDGEYFKVDKMISDDYETKIVVNRRQMLSSIDRSMLLVRETDKKPIILKITDAGLELSMNTVIGSMKEKLDIVKEGRDLMIGFNPRFLSEALKAIDEEEVTIYMMNPKAPCFIRNTEKSYIYLILPINFVAAE